jgi:hypothetical protein
MDSNKISASTEHIRLYIFNRLISDILYANFNNFKNPNQIDFKIQGHDCPNSFRGQASTNQTAHNSV